MQHFTQSVLTPAFTNSFAPSPSINFAKSPYDLPISELARRVEAPKPSTRREFIIQQERNIKNDFLRKPGSKSVASLPTNSATGANLQHDKVNVKPGFSATRLKLVASVVALGLVLFTGQLGCSFLSQQLSGHKFHLASAGHPAAATTAESANASAGSNITTPNGTETTATSPYTIDETHKIDSLIAAAQGVGVLETAEPTLASKASPVSTSAVNQLTLTNVSTLSLVKIGYERLRTGSAQESISILSEAVRRDRNDPVSRRYLGYALLQAGRPSEALGQYDALSKLSGLLPSDRLAMQHAMRTAQAKG